ncbi:MAG: hypothetical protein A2V85_05690 [Chloroflexi bacterium RBG_16_72_14]|nr:MAG: hypothetical protein A2V85_05690 [Chloroflexi bacterium RBG_16_72_14]
MDTADAVARLYPDWPQHAARISDAIRGLTTEQLALRASPDHSPVWALAAHTAGSRVYWLCGVFGEPGADATPFPDPLAELGWEDDETHPRTAEEIGWALESSWAVVAGCLGRWTMRSLDTTAERRWRDVVQVHTRASVLNRLFTHDAYHAGEISQLLGVNGLPAIDLWRRLAPQT